MRKTRIFLMIAALVASQSLFAHDMSKACGDVAKACKDAGYSMDAGSNKEFWHDCMKPVLLNKKVDGVTVDAATAKTCRTDKITQLKDDLAAFKAMK